MRVSPEAGRPLSIVSVCRELPNPDKTSTGIFVARRLEAMASRCDHVTLQPVNYFPVLRPLPGWARQPSRPVDGLDLVACQQPMFYIPKFLKHLDGYWLEKAVHTGLAQQKAQRSVDLVDAHFGYPEGSGSLRAAHRLGLPCMVTLRGFEAEYLERPRIGDEIRTMLQTVDGCICVSHFLRELAIDNGADPDRTTVIHNAIDGDLFHTGDKKAERQKLGLDTNEKIVVSVGHLVARKGHHRLIDAFAAVAGAEPQARLLIVGGPSFERDYPASLRSQVDTLGLSGKVRFMGDVAASDIAGILRAADVFALSTSREGCCNAVLEALACGLPVVTTPVGDNAYFVEDDRNGYIVPLKGSTGLAEALKKALTRQWVAEDIAAQLGVGSWGDVADCVLEFGRSVIAQSRA